MLQLKYREVAQANIDQFDRLGGFRGEVSGSYHYPDEADNSSFANNTGCSIGIMDTKNELLPYNEGYAIRMILKDHPEIVTADNPDRIIFIQALHDFRLGLWPDADSFIAQCTRSYGQNDGAPRINPVIIPHCALDLIREIRTSDDVTPELYKEVMARLAAE